MPSAISAHPFIFWGAGFCAVVCVFFLVLFLREIWSGSDFSLVSSEWRGLGGGLGGLRISTAFSYAIFAVVFGLLMTILISEQVSADRSREVELLKYEDANKSRQAELEKARILAGAGTVEKKVSPNAAENKN
jgi:hypothetical protein